ncbi:MAG: molybdopterin cofactor-binding domain-containing protein, partial [Nitriliruptoraceae bacterium]
ELSVEERFSAGAQTFPYGTVVAVVEVDEDTGKVSLERIVAVDDCGTVVNPVMVEGQVHGSLAQGIAQALLEEIVYDEHAQLRTASLVDYLVPMAADLPHFETGRIETPAPSNPLGAKGTGESGAIGAPPAVVNAVLDALRPLGVEHLDMPLTPEKVWHALHRARAAAPAA